MRTSAGSRDTFGKRDPRDRAAATSADRHGAGSRPNAPGTDGSAPAAAQGTDPHPQRVRHDHFLSEIF